MKKITGNPIFLIFFGLLIPLLISLLLQQFSYRLFGGGEEGGFKSLLILFTGVIIGGILFISGFIKYRKINKLK